MLPITFDDLSSGFNVGTIVNLDPGKLGMVGFTESQVKRYVDDANNYVTVEEGRDEKDHFYNVTLPNGRTVKDKTRSKVRVTLPDNTRFIAYQRLSPFGNLFMTDDEQWEYLVQGTGCFVAHLAKDGQGYQIAYQGTLCASERNPLNEKKPKGSLPHRSSAPQGFKPPEGSSRR